MERMSKSRMNQIGVGGAGPGRTDRAAVPAVTDRCRVSVRELAAAQP